MEDKYAKIVSMIKEQYELEKDGRSEIYLVKMGGKTNVGSIQQKVFEPDKIYKLVFSESIAEKGTYGIRIAGHPGNYENHELFNDYPNDLHSCFIKFKKPIHDCFLSVYTA